MTGWGAIAGNKLRLCHARNLMDVRLFSIARPSLGSEELGLQYTAKASHVHVVVSHGNNQHTYFFLPGFLINELNDDVMDFEPGGSDPGWTLDIGNVNELQKGID